MEEQIKQANKRGPKQKESREQVPQEQVEIPQEENLKKETEEIVKEEPIETVLPSELLMDEPKVFPIRRQVHYIVKKRDSLEDIAERFNKTEAEIAKDNNLSLNIPLCAGTSLLIYLD